MIRLLPGIVIFISLVILAPSSVVLGQSVCEMTLTRAQEEFDAGRFYAVPGILKECIEKGQNREWDRRAYLLLAETYLLLEDASNADKAYLKVLRADPEFLTDETRDPIDLVYLSKKFTSTPIFSVYAKLGLNTSPVRPIHDVQITSQPGLEESYSLRVGWQGGVGLDYHYNERLGLSAEFNYFFTNFSHETKRLFDNNSQDFNNRQTWTNIPVLFKYSKTTGGLRPYFYGGYAFNLLLRDRVDIVINNNNESPSFDFLPVRNRVNTGLVVGGGLKYKWGLRYLFGDLRYNFGLSNIANLRYNGDVIWRWPYVDDNFRMDNLIVNIGYIHPFYMPRQLKKVRTKSVLRRIRKGSNDKE